MSNVSFIERRSRFNFYENDIVDSFQWKINANRVSGLIGGTISFHHAQHETAYMTGTILTMRRLVAASGITADRDVGRYVFTFKRDKHTQEIIHIDGWSNEKNYW